LLLEQRTAKPFQIKAMKKTFLTSTSVLISSTLFFVLFFYGPSQAQINFWNKVNKGFGIPCPNMRFGSGTVAATNTFSIPTNGGSTPLSSRKGQMYALIKNSSCESGQGALFRFDTTSLEWIKVAIAPPGMDFAGGAFVALYTNNSTILGLYPDGLGRMSIAEHTGCYLPF